MSRFSAPVHPRARSRTGPASAIATRTIGAYGRTSRSSSRQLPIRPRAQGSKPAQGQDRYADRRGSSAPRSGAMVPLEVEAARPVPHSGERLSLPGANGREGSPDGIPRSRMARALPDQPPNYLWSGAPVRRCPLDSPTGSMPCADPASVPLTVPEYPHPLHWDHGY